MKAIAAASLEASNAQPLPSTIRQPLDRAHLAIVVPAELLYQGLHLQAMLAIDTGLPAASLLKASPKGEGFHPPRLGH